MTSLPALLIAGASGKLGRRTAELVLERRTPADLILVSRTPAALADLAQRGADVRFGDLDRPDSLGTAFAGAGKMLLISASDVDVRAEQHRNGIGAAAAAGVSHIVYTSGPNPAPPNPALIAPSHHATEQALATSGLAWTILRNSLYGEYQAAEAAAALAAGVLVHNRGAGRIAYVSREDCAAAAAAVLTTTGHEGSVYDVTGPELFGAPELAALYGELGGGQVADEPVDDETFVERVTGSAGDAEHARYGALLVASLGRSIREGYMASCSADVELLTGRPARPLREVLAADLSWARPPAGALDPS